MKHHRKYSLAQRKADGWDKNLYRNTKERMVAGVCAGLADNFEVDNWVVRLVFIAGGIFLGGFAVVTYIALWVFLGKRSASHRVEYEYDERSRRYRPKKVFKNSDSANVRLQRVSDRLKRAVRRVEEMESYVTSRKFELDKEFAKIRD
ncbi:PspC domain-containing protein [Gynuella sunshinyii]|uniref:Putative stress-responsive transcriptional regulator n=1 Tax=Gynuella sunshinyii YC6258 TaxID=1445510 RepID=A0A0C5VGW3_9GAMM|nr:PspC domain-containing protein [Gynuella sunshinyii]AJQ92603.1 putative stress-responsive transcriptional regulator [Gynuella sunshinyii YC6258]